MALPPGFLDDLRARVPISDVVGRRVRWDARRSNAAKGDFWACCPFHQERSPSFHVDDRKGFYHCFGCHAKGDAVTFLREAEGLGFMEAVEELARMAGVEVPREGRPDPQAAARSRAQAALTDWMEEAARFYAARLNAPAAQEARAYLARRGLSPETQARFGIGYASPDRVALRDHLTAKGAPAEALVEAGLVALPDDGGAPYDRFRDRIMFPIRDGRGRCIAFGGRAMSAQARAKYLNSPQTVLFDKSRTLYNLGPAREAAAKSGALIVAEGYMDVIALAQAGFAHAVAPLGTAVTPEHLRMMWRIADEPVIALDGDAAGLAAGQRVVDLALPLLGPGKSLRFALLPGGKDPDDLIREGGAAAFRAVLDAAEPMAALLWRRETEGRVFDSPERRAALDRRLRDALSKIVDEGLRAHYRADLAERRAALFAPARPARAPAWTRKGPWRGRGGAASGWIAPLTSETRASALALAGPQDRAAMHLRACRLREASMLAALLRHPALAERWGDDLASVEFAHADLDALRGALLFGGSVDAAAVFAEAGHAAELGFARAGAAEAEAEQGFAEALARQAAEAALMREIAEAEQALGCEPGAGPGGEVDGRIRQAVLGAQREAPGRLEERDDDEARLSQELRDAISDEIWIRKKRKR
ncbi:MAG: DNA primase [Rubrimonas sp.]|uniref:DNA primase n=1 Tax=Rubrimonas sp. TaxID=2036015 RepID=UPI002FDCD22B